MTQDIAEHLRKLTSRNGRYWLRDSRKAPSAVDAAQTDLPFRSVSNSQTNVTERKAVHESIVVSIPDVAELNAAATDANSTTVVSTPSPVAQPMTIERQIAPQTRVVSPLPQLHAIPPDPHPATKAKAVELAPTIPDVNQFSAGFEGSTTIAKPSPKPSLVEANEFPSIEANELEQVPFKTAVTATAPLATPKLKVAAHPSLPSPNDEAVKAARNSQSKESNDSIAKIADQMIERFPVAAASVLMIAGSQASLHADETCARVAAELASRNLGRVLLIDSDFVGRRLTKAGGMAKQGGLSEILNIAYPWQEAVLKSGSSKLDFMAAGNCPHKRWTPKSALREAVAEIRAEYQFVCVSVGDAHNSAAGLWSELADGALLVVSATQSSQAIAESAANELREIGARMIGCVVADVDSEAA